MNTAQRPEYAKLQSAASNVNLVFLFPGLVTFFQ